jgi:hypothetical protein
MLKNPAIAIAISSALLALSLVDATRAATPLATVRVAPKSTKPPHAPGDFDRAFIVHQTGEIPSPALETEKPLDAVNRDRSTSGSCNVEPGSLGVATDSSSTMNDSTDSGVEHHLVTGDPRNFVCRER